MSRSHEPATSRDEPVRYEDLVEFFARAQRPDIRDHRVGTELEKFGVVVSNAGAKVDPYPVRYRDHIVPVLHGLVERYGWEAGDDRGDGDAMVELVRDGASITLEPGAQLELSGKPLHDVHETCAEFTQHHDELHAVSEPLGIAWMTVGFHPFATREDIDWVPKARYRVMRSYLPTRGAKALDMMLRTCTVQANFDYRDEAQCGERYRLALALGPYVAAMFANAPYVEGASNGMASRRAEVWPEVDPDRCGVPAFMFDGAFTFARYVEWALDIPMFFVKRGHEYHPYHGSFRSYMRDGFEAPDGQRHRATRGDWSLHLSTVFPDARLKPYVEVRTADAIGSRFVCALPALWKGLLYDADASEQAWELVRSHFTPAKHLAASKHASTAGLASDEVFSVCARLVDLAATALSRADIRDGKGRTEARFLEPLAAAIQRRSVPGSDVLERLGTTPGTSPEAKRRMIEAFHFAGASP